MSIQDLISTYPSRKELCRAMGCSRQFLSQIENGKRPFPVRLALKVERLTGGRFTAAGLCPDVFEPMPAEQVGEMKEIETLKESAKLGL
jgi:transcriptional regulator with XRE-family HTH domain